MRIDQRVESKALTITTILKVYENNIGAGLIQKSFGLITILEKMREALNGRKKLGVCDILTEELDH